MSIVENVIEVTYRDKWKEVLAQLNLDKNLNKTKKSAEVAVDYLPVEDLAIEDSDKPPSKSTWYDDQLEFRLKSKKQVIGKNRSSGELSAYCLNSAAQSPLKNSAKLNRSTPHLESIVVEKQTLFKAKSSTPPESPIPNRFVKLRNKSSGNSPFQIRAEKAASVYGDILQSNAKKQRPRSSIFASSAIMRRPRNSSISLLGVLDNKKLRTAFLEFLESEYSSENLLFWLACEKFRKLKSEEQRFREANHIHSQFVSHDAINQINIDHLRRREITLALNTDDVISVNIFDSAKKYVFTIMENDSFPRFLSSSFYKDAVAGKRGGIESMFSNFLPGNRSSSSGRVLAKSSIKNSNNNSNKMLDNEQYSKSIPKLVRRLSFGFKKTNSIHSSNSNRSSAPELNNPKLYHISVGLA